jgi:hypothetical protein
MLIGENAGNKKKKAEEYHLTIHEGREHILKLFPILQTLAENTPKIQQPHNIQSSLF